MEDEIKLTPFQYTAYWWVKRMKDFVEDVIKVGYSTYEGVEFTQMFDCLKDEHWRALYLRLTPLIEEEFKKTGRFVQSTKGVSNDHYVGHAKINEMLESIIKLDIPDPTLNPSGTVSTVLVLCTENGATKVFTHNDDGSDIVYFKTNLNVKKDYILTGDRSLLPAEETL